MDGFKQIRTFYSWVFNNPDKVRQSHISLYVFLINQNNRSMWVEWFKCPRDLAMAGACIGSNNTYYKVLDDLQNWNLLEYKKGINDFKAPMIKLTCLYKSEQLTEQVSAPLSETLPAPLPEQLSEQLSAPIYKLITSNLKLINSNEKKVFEFINSLSDNKKTETETKKQIKDRYYKFISEFCNITGSKVKGSDNDLNNFAFWLKTYSPSEIIQAVKNHDDTFWAEKINPQWLFRTKDTKGQPVDYIGQLLNHKKAKTIL